MVIRILTILALFLTTQTSAQLAKDLPLVPFPREVNMSNYEFPITEDCVIIHLGNQKKIAQLLQAGIKERTGMELELVRGPSAAMFEKRGIFISTGHMNGDFTKESYRIKVSENLMVISGQTDEGAFRGTQTLLQLVPMAQGKFNFPALEIIDSPKFAHRGMLLDCVRHFWSVDVVKKYIDLLAFYKMNVLHWHLTDDQGWRIEIDAYPELTKIGAWRTEADGSRYGGFYSKEDIEEIVSYAKERFITVIPEVEMPGHSLAALAAYPQLSCTGESVEVSSEWGVFNDVYCAGNDSTFAFIEGVLTEVLDMFPSDYIHIGGDESPRFRWKNCEQCQRRIKEEALQNEDELQSYFLRRVQQFLVAHDRKMIGWDEILEGGLIEEATVQSWRGIEGAVQAARSGNDAIMSPRSHCYLDYSLQAIDLEKIYSFDPIPDQLERHEEKYILGAECNMWTEHVPDAKTLDWKVMPRMIGLAEVLWTYPEQRNTDWLRARLNDHYKWLDAQKVNYGFDAIPITFDTKAEGDKLYLTPITKGDGVNAYYTTNGKMPGITKNPLIVPIELSKDVLVKVLATQHGRAYPEIFEIPLSVHKALGQSVTSTEVYSQHFSAGGFEALSDGFLGSLNFKDGRWQGYQGTDLRFEINFGYPRPITEVGAHFYQGSNAWIFPPESISISSSLDGQTFTESVTVPFEGNLKSPDALIEFLNSEYEVTTQYLRIDVKNMGPCPEWHEAAGSDSWIFIDEIIVK